MTRRYIIYGIYLQDAYPNVLVPLACLLRRDVHCHLNGISLIVTLFRVKPLRPAMSQWHHLQGVIISRTGHLFLAHAEFFRLHDSTRIMLLVLLTVLHIFQGFLRLRRQDADGVSAIFCAEAEGLRLPGIGVC